MIPRYHTPYGLSDFCTALIGTMRSSLVHLRPELFGIDGNGSWMVPALRGREALFVLLRSLALPAGSGIGVPLFVCSCVPQTVVEAGFTPVFVDTNFDDFGPDLTDLEGKAHRIAAFVLVYTLGRPVDVDAVRQILPGKPLIEDCAQAMGSSFHGRALGSFGDAAFFTFGFFKPVPAGGGGALVLYDRQIAERASAIVSRSRPQGLTSHLRHNLVCLIKGTVFRNPAYSLFIRMRPSAAETPQGASTHSQTTSRPLRIRPGDSAVIQRHLTATVRSLPGMDSFWSELRASIPAEWHVPVEPIDGIWNHFVFCIRSPTAERCARAVERLRASGISAARLFPNCRKEMEPTGYTGGCPISEQLSSLAFTIPFHHALSLPQRRKILERVPEILRST